MLQTPDISVDKAVSAADTSDSALAEPLQQALEAIAVLERTVREKEQALIGSAAAAAEFKLQLDETKDQNEKLQTKLGAAAKINETLAARAQAMDPASGEKLVPESEIIRMKEQMRASQKALEKEQDRLRTELVKSSAGWQRSNHQLEIQARAHSAESDRSLSRVAALERKLESAEARAANQAGSDASRRMWIKLSVASAGTAVLMLGAAAWMQFSPVSHAAGASSEVPHPQAVTAVKSPLPDRPAPSRGQFQKSLSRLNEALSASGSASAEQMLRAVRKANAKTDPGVCNIQWNNGQPALNFGSGGSLSVESTLDRCAIAVEKYLKN
jgi:hypothetical protein